MKRLLSILIAVGCSVAAPSSQAALSGALSPSVQNSAAGSELVFSGTLTNTSGTENLFLNDVRVEFTGAAIGKFGADSNLFFASVPGILLPNETFIGELFRVALKSNAPSADYAGTVTFQGGTNIFETNDLVTTGFSALSPAVSLVATTPFASELGPVAGAFTLSRSGGTVIDLTVQLDIAGTATNGASYQGISSSFTIPAGAAATNIVITPVPDDVVQGDRLVMLTLSNSIAYNLSANSNATVTIRDKPVDIWRLQKFGLLANSPAGADKGDWDADGRANLLEYSLNLNPTSAEPEPLLPPTVVNDYLTLSYVPSLTAIDVVLLTESSTNLATWSTNDVEVVIVPNPIPPERVTVRYKYPISQAGPAYLRLKTMRVP